MNPRRFDPPRPFAGWRWPLLRYRLTLVAFMVVGMLAAWALPTFTLSPIADAIVGGSPIAPLVAVAGLLLPCVTGALILAVGAAVLALLESFAKHDPQP